MITKQVDVLIIGGGLAGLTAALSAYEHTKNILLVSKGKIARSGNTLVSGGGISAALEDESGQNNPTAFYNDIIKSGKGLADEGLALMLTKNSGAMLDKLYSYGVKFIKETDGTFRVRRPPGHSVARNVPTQWDGIAYANRGLSFSLPVYAQCQQLEIPMLEGWSLIELLTHQNMVCGAVFADRAGEQMLVKAKSIVLASGGYGFLFEKSNNTSDILGEGIALAMSIGCRVRDMEQVQFYPTMMFDPVKITVSNPLFGEGAVLRNRNGERFMHKYDADGDMATRDNMARAIFLEVQSGLGVDDKVYFDCTGINPDKLLSRFGNFYEFLKTNRIDLTKDYLKVSPCVHYTLGGLVIDTNCMTDVSGLYAAGEVTGGIHGANRLSGAALMETCVFGWEAGKNAAVDSCSKDFLTCSYSGEYLQATSPNALKNLRQIMWQFVSVMRTEQGLKQAKQKLEELLSDNPSLQPLINVCQAVIEAAILRTESRGAHYREDYRDQDMGMKTSTICKINPSKKIQAGWM